MIYEEWLDDEKTVDAVVRNIEIIGEAAANIGTEYQRQYSDIPWNEMKAIRNILAHEYFGIDKEIIWKTIQDDLPPLKRRIEKILE